MNEEQIRKIVKDEFDRNYGSGAPRVAPHNHDGSNNLQISQVNVIPSISASGSIVFANVKRYTLNIVSNPNPTQVLCYGNVIGDTGQKYFTFGNAYLGPSYYFQPQTTSSVQAGPSQPFIQENAYFGAISAGGTMHTLITDGHLVDVQYPVGTIHARMTLVGFTPTSITLDVTDLDSGWVINANLVVI